MIKKYIWLNPIVEAMVRKNRHEVREVLEKKGYTIVACTNGAGLVRKAYLDYVSKTSRLPVIDARCPKVTTLIREKYPLLADNIAPIEPILLTCAEELYAKYVTPDVKGTALIVISPCTWLVKRGDLLFGEKVCFLTWKDFCEKEGLSNYPRLEASPVPPGFFTGLDLPVIEANGGKDVEAVLQRASEKTLPRGTLLLELLYCEGGCHLGDGL